MPRPLRRNAPLRRPRHSAKEIPDSALFDERGTMNLDETDKHAVVRDLILRHSAERAAHPEPSKWMVRAGVFACGALVFVGWWMTLDTNLHFPLRHAAEQGLVDTVRQRIKIVNETSPYQMPTTEEVKNGWQAKRVEAAQQAVRARLYEQAAVSQTQSSSTQEEK